ncbi:hypothetical protein THFILI_00640 [Thermus filiformis]|uniref:Uncharacterized protein n=1 Tax=Thermus filiformis TaxID=276 RepID=A0A0D6XAU4_THEFI|nr:hypothetical protein THFILI_00640 [Thermus filiformis]
MSVSIPSVLYLKTPPGVPFGNQGEKASELFLPAGEWVLEVVANGRWRLEVYGTFLGVRVRQAPGQVGEVVLPGSPGPLLVAEGRGRGQVVLELSSCSPTCRVVLLP